MSKTAALTIQKWGNSLAIRIPATIARNAHIYRGTPVLLAVQNDQIIIQPSGKRKLKLEDRLALFDPEKHGGEVMETKLIGREKF